jgi:hypothetical protein
VVICYGIRASITIVLGRQRRVVGLGCVTVAAALAVGCGRGNVGQEGGLQAGDKGDDVAGYGESSRLAYSSTSNTIVFILTNRWQ